MTTVSWFSAGVSSAVATKLAIDQIDRIIYIHIDDQHGDTLRFVADCQDWFGKRIEVLQSPLKSVENACLSAGGKGYLNGPTGAACSLRLKKAVRKEWEKENGDSHNYIWGLDAAEENRMYNIFCSSPNAVNRFPLLDTGMQKADVHKIATASGIKRPAMYDLGYHNNNCIGCVKGGKGYWNKIRVDFPKVFEARARLERKIGASCIKERVKVHGEEVTRRVYLDELDPKAGRHEGPIVAACGLICEQVAI